MGHHDGGAPLVKPTPKTDKNIPSCGIITAKEARELTRKKIAKMIVEDMNLDKRIRMECSMGNSQLSVPIGENHINSIGVIRDLLKKSGYGTDYKQHIVDQGGNLTIYWN